MRSGEYIKANRLRQTPDTFLPLSSHPFAMTTKHVLDVGNCNPDHASITALLRRLFSSVEVDRTHGMDDTLAALRQRPYDLVLVNRKLDQDYSDGLDIIQRMKADETLRSIPVMLLTNYPEHQELAVQAGAEYGFGKLEFEKPITREKLSRFLE